MTVFVCAVALVAVLDQLAGILHHVEVTRLRRQLLEAAQSGLLQAEVDGDGRLRMLSIPVLMPACDRPQFLAPVLRSLKNSNAADRFSLIVSLDCTHDAEVLRLLREEAPPHTVVLHHRKPFFGLPALAFGNEYFTSQNVFFLLDTAFHHLRAAGAIVIESDVEVAVDFYEFFSWALQEADRKSDVFSVNGYNKHSETANDLAEMKEDEFMVWGWAVSRSRWRLIRRRFTSTNNWDHTMERMRQDAGLVSWTPAVARTRHIGFSGINFKLSSEQGERMASLPISEGTIDYRYASMKVLNATVPRRRLALPPTTDYWDDIAWGM